MKSMRPPSAHCRSSKTSTVGAAAAIRSKKVRHAVKSASRPPAGGSPTPRSASRAGSIQRRSASSGTYSASVAAIRARVVASSSDSTRRARWRTISPSDQKVTPSPYAGERPSCQ